MIARPTAARRRRGDHPGFKYNLADINAALALVQLEKLSHANQRRTEIAQRYLRELADTPFKPLSVPTRDHQHAASVYHPRR